MGERFYTIPQLMDAWNMTRTGVNKRLQRHKAKAAFDAFDVRGLYESEVKRILDEAAASLQASKERSGKTRTAKFKNGRVVRLEAEFRIVLCLDCNAEFRERRRSHHAVSDYCPVCKGKREAKRRKEAADRERKGQRPLLRLVPCIATEPPAKGEHPGDCPKVVRQKFVPVDATIDQLMKWFRVSKEVISYRLKDGLLWRVPGSKYLFAKESVALLARDYQAVGWRPAA